MYDLDCPKCKKPMEKYTGTLPGKNTIGGVTKDVRVMTVLYRCRNCGHDPFEGKGAKELGE